MLYFRNRQAARDFAKKQDHYKVVDCKNNLSLHRNWRWAVRTLR